MTHTTQRATSSSRRLGFLALATVVSSSVASAQWVRVSLGGGQPLAVGGNQQVGSYADDAALWSGTASSFVNLGPGIALATDGAQQVGRNGAGYAALWTGTEASRLDLTPNSIYHGSTATGVDGGIQCGYLSHSVNSYPGTWAGTADSWLPLGNLQFVNSSTPLAIHAGVIVGIAWQGSARRAVLWPSRSSPCDSLHPIGFSAESGALAVHAGQQAGWTTTGSGQPQHAALWSSTAASWVDLHPAIASSSIAHGITAGLQVGEATIGSNPHASVWTGTAASWVDLHATLPPGTLYSVATGAWTDAAGVEFISGYAIPGGAVLWMRATNGSVFCSGDGSAAACPCGNASAPGSGVGCLNSLGTGARLASTGTASLSADTLVLHCSGMTNSFALYIQGAGQVADGQGVVFGDGLLCAGDTILRLRTKLNAGGASSVPAPRDPPVSALGVVQFPGLRVYQTYYRNVAAFCTPASFNLSNGLEVTWSP